MVNSDLKSRAADDSASVDTQLAALLSESLTELAKSGQADAACRLAGRACALLRGSNAKEWTRFNKLLHRLSPMTGGIEARPVDAVSGAG